MAKLGTLAVMPDRLISLRPHPLVAEAAGAVEPAAVAVVLAEEVAEVTRAQARTSMSLLPATTVG